MPNALAPCPSCRRHVRADDAACAFCATALSPRAALARATLAVALSAGVAAVAGCGNEPRPVYGGPPPGWNRGDPTPPPSDTAVQPVGPPAPSASSSTPVPVPSPPDTTRLAPAYGGPPPTPGPAPLLPKR